jgi:hypothetical protein
MMSKKVNQNPNKKIEIEKQIIISWKMKFILPIIIYPIIKTLQIIIILNKTQIKKIKINTKIIITQITE